MKIIPSLSLSQWQQWLETLSHGDTVLYQQFVPAEYSAINVRQECWRFYVATFYGDRIEMEYKPYPIKDGVAVSWNSDNPFGLHSVFCNRIVPFTHDLEPSSRGGFVEAYNPVCEPEWEDAERCFVLVPNGPNAYKNSHSLKRFSHLYMRDVSNGGLFVIFANAEDVHAMLPQIGSDIRFLYFEQTKL